MDSTTLSQNKPPLVKAYDLPAPPNSHTPKSPFALKQEIRPTFMKAKLKVKRHVEIMLPLLRKWNPSQYHFSIALIMVLCVGTNDRIHGLNCWPRTFRE